jgi:hypothetical protein
MPRHLLLLTVLFVGFQAHSQSTECLSRSVVMTVVAMPRRHESPLILTPADLHTKVGDKDVPVESVVHSPNPSRIAVILEIGSRQTKSAWDTKLVIARALPGQFPDKTEFSLVVFDDKVQGTVPFKPGPHALDEALAALSPSKHVESEAALYDALAAGIGTFGGFRPGDAMFLITAWEGGAKSDRLEGLLRSLSENGIRLFGVSIGQSAIPGVKLTQDVFFYTPTRFTALGTASAISGGLWFRGPEGAPTSWLLTSAASAMSDFYTIALRLTQPIGKPEKLRIEMAPEGGVHVKPEVNPKDVRFFYPPMLSPCR